MENEITTTENELTISSANLEKDTQALVNDILNEKDPKKVKDLTYLFNIAQTKKSVLRAVNLNNLLDRVNDQMEERLTKRADQFSNKDLLDYMDKMTGALEKAQKQVQDVDPTPAIQINQQNINLGEAGLSRESRQNVMDAVASILKRLNEESLEEPEIIEEEPVLDNDIEDTTYSQDGEEEISIPTLKEEGENI